MNDSKMDFTGLLEPQIPHSIKLLNSIYLNGVAFDHSGTGCGKTYCASWIVKQLNLPVVVISPKNVMNKWKTVLKQFGITPKLVINYEKLMRGNTPYVKYRPQARKFNVKTKQYEEESLAKFLLVQVNLPAGCVILLDEGHKCKGFNSLNSGLMISLKRQGYKVLSLSATQAVSVLEMRAFGYMANLHDLYHWKQWCLAHGAEEVGKWGAMTFNSEDEEAMEKMKACHDSLFKFQEISSRLTREMMGDLFPENIVTAEAYDLEANDPKIRAVYDEMDEEIAKMDEDSENYSAHIFAVIMKARRRAEMLKVPLFHEMFEDWYDEGISPVVFLNFTESILALNERLSRKKRYKNKIGLIYGDIPQKQRDIYIDEFLADKRRGMIVNTKSGASFDLNDMHGKYPRGSLINPSFSAVDMIQCMGRIDRTGTKTKCIQRFVFAANCIEERAAHRVQAKVNNLSCLNDGDLTMGIKIFH